jgi:hypothetical protein
MAAVCRREGRSPEMVKVGAGRWHQDTSRQQHEVRDGEHLAPTRDHRPSRALNSERAVTVEVRATARAIAHPLTSLDNEEEGSVARKSEAPIVAMNSGNAGGAKGCRREITDQGYMARH